MVSLHPRGPIGLAERHLILVVIGLMLIVVIPVFIMTAWFAWRYRASNTKAKYTPNWSYSAVVDLIIWAVPALLIAVLGTLAWTSSHKLDPYKPIDMATKPLRIEAVSMDWKWLFIYPDQNIAVVNKLVFPAHVPLNFKLTSSTVMTSFMIPRLGGQIYAMAGMQTRLHLLANAEGTYRGLNYQYSGNGFPDMNFQAIATSPQQFEAWIKQVKRSPKKLDDTQLKLLEQPSARVPVSVYSSVKTHLFRDIIDRFKNHGPSTASVRTNATASSAENPPVD